MARSPYIHIDLGKLDRELEEKEGIRLKSADVVRSSPDLAIVNVEVEGEARGLRFDLGKQVFFDSLGAEHLDEALSRFKKPLLVKITEAKKGASRYKGSLPLSNIRIKKVV